MPDPVKSTVLTVKNPITGEPVPVYLGGDPPVPTESLSTEPEDRGNTLPEETKVPETKVPETKVPETKVPETKVEETKVEETKEPSDEKRIPKKRFDEVNERRKAAEARVAELEKQLKPESKPVEETKYDFDAKEQDYINLLLDGKTQEAAALRKEIRAAERAETERLVATKATDATVQFSVQERLDQVVAKAEQDYPQFNAESDEFSEDLLDDVKAFYAGHLQTGKYEDAAEAFQAAIDKAVKLHDIVKPGTKTTSSAPTRTAEKRVEAIANQPPVIAKVGTSSSTHGDMNIDVHALSDTDFARLPEATKRRLRGDDL